MNAKLFKQTVLVLTAIFIFAFNAFAGEVVNGVGVERLREELDSHLLEWLPTSV